ncbi:acyl-CoA-like ligand-binding transcription factor [Actinacidiphila epipremni]|jgi:AcrR family transcriptional regulator|uniref:TetR family transcriptional regulator n=1 Tax=Actinacidiphila epipremni TaxID=2053013 RepID=A0ABX0ZPX7_9ACTN|nr:TetR family transcriptional regulator [Actinacidiphila epipremni]NJP43681.1 TetR family transcriptional regulator [Actinacidiphila epipremni]
MNAKETPAAPEMGLRERKKLRTMETIRREAYRLFAAQGYEATTVDQIADAAEVSPSTFFRYFPTKEDVVLDDDYDDTLAAALRSRPPGEPVIESLRHGLADSLGRQLEADREDLLLRTRLGFTDPALRARSWDEMQRSQDVVAALICERTGRDPGDLDAHCAAAALIAVSTAVVRYWVEHDGKVDLVPLYDRQFAQLAAGLRL